jgi:hypothetical protein
MEKLYQTNMQHYQLFRKPGGATMMLEYTKTRDLTDGKFKASIVFYSPNVFL